MTEAQAPAPVSPPRLADRNPSAGRERLLRELLPPPRFADVRFATYVPDPAHPSQAAARENLQRFAAELSAPQRAAWAFWRRTDPAANIRGMYLDGGFGVGKTHLLASLWHAAPAPKAFTTFTELTSLVGALTFPVAAEALSGYRLLCIDEFELDDPGDTVLLSSLLARLAEAGVALAATSNTLPDALGEGRFAAGDFLREIQGLAARFSVVRIEGEDYRHRGMPAAPPPIAEEALVDFAAAQSGATLDDWDDLVVLLGRLHPSRYGALVEDVAAVCLRGVAPVTDQAVALRLVALADRLYDRGIPVRTSGVPLDEVFPAEMMSGGYRKKYARAVSRLIALTREQGAAP